MLKGFEIEIKDYFENKPHGHLSGILNDNARKVKFKNISYRQLNSWEKEGLVPVNREGKEWRKFSIVECVWVKLIKELREFGLSRKSLRMTRNSLELDSGKYNAPMPMLEFFIAQALSRKVQILLLVFKNGILLPCSLQQYEAVSRAERLENHVHIDLNAILSEILPDLDLGPSSEPQPYFNASEIELLGYLRLGNFEKITIKLNNGEMEKFEGVQRLEGRTRIEQIIREHAYQDIEIREEGGGITAIFQTIKKKFTNGSKPR